MARLTPTSMWEQCCKNVEGKGRRQMVEQVRVPKGISKDDFLTGRQFLQPCGMGLGRPYELP